MTPVAFQESSWKPPADSHMSIAYRLWTPSESKALLVIIHGFGEHSGRYSSLAEALAGRGFSVAVPDICGHGRSSGKRGDIADVPDCVALLRQLTKEKFLPLTGHSRYALYGHSFGGLAVIRWAMEGPKELSRLIVQSPLLKVAFRIPVWKESLASAMSALWPTFSLPMNLDASALSHDPAVVQAYKSDPQVYNKISVRCYRSIVNTQHKALAHPEAVAAPTLLLCGQADRIISVPAARAWFDRLKCQKKIVEFPDSYHELHHEPIRQRVIEELASWAALP